MQLEAKPVSPRAVGAEVALGHGESWVDLVLKWHQPGSLCRRGWLHWPYVKSWQHWPVVGEHRGPVSLFMEDNFIEESLVLLSVDGGVA